MTATRPGNSIALRVAVLLVVVLSGLYGASLLGFNPFKSGQSETALLNSIQDTSKYVAAVGDFEVVVDDKDDNLILPNIISGRRTIFVGAGTVNAYVDLSGLAEDDLTLSEGGKSVKIRLPEAQPKKQATENTEAGLAEEDLTLSEGGKSVKIRLPEAQLEKPNLDQDRTKLISQDRGVLDQINDALTVPEQAKFYKMAEEKIAAAAEESELKKRATENTKAMLTGMFSSMEIQATFRD